MKLVRFRYLPDDVLKVAKEAIRGLQEQLARMRERYTAALPVKQNAAELLFQQLDLPANGRLRDVESLPGAREAALFGHGAKHLHLSDVHRIAPGYETG